jgi:hypothetical protein
MKYMLVLYYCVTLAVLPTSTRTQMRVHDTAAAIVLDIQRADYQGDRAALEKLHDDLAKINAADEVKLRSRILYWQGFAKWRRAINGFNVNTDTTELEADVRTAVSEFEASRAADPTFIDADVAMLGCLQNMMFLYRNDQSRAREVLQRFLALFKELQQKDPDNPRFAWLDGGGQFYMAQFAKAEERGQQQAAAFETYRRGLERARKLRRPASVLEPSWGEPELLMSMAWARLNQVKPDVAAAEKYAKDALALVPDWAYMKNTLMPQIQKAKGAVQQ